MDVDDAIGRVLLGESMRQLGSSYREGLLRDCGLEPEEASASTLVKETRRFLGQVCRALGDRHPDDRRVASALSDWVREVEDYEAFDTLLAGDYRFDGREHVLRRGRSMFPGPLTAHWEDRG